MFRATARRFAQHRTPSIRFPDRKQPLPTHEAGPHPAAPSSIASSFQTFLSKFQSSAADSTPSPGVPLAGPAGGSGQSRGGFSKLPMAEFEGDWELEVGGPKWLRRSRNGPTDEEIDAVLSGGASVSPVVSKASKKAWYTPAIL